MTMQRREWLWAAGVAAVAAAGGAGYAALRSRGSEGDFSSAEAALWSQAFDTPDGARLTLADFPGKALVLNFWATWCPPCIREMPALERFQRSHADRGWQVIGLAVDHAEPVRKFVAMTRISFPVGLAGFAGIELSRRLGNTAGGLPFTLVIDRDRRVRQRRSGETNEAELARWAAEGD